MYASFLLLVLLPVTAATVTASQPYHGDVTSNGHPSLGERVERLERLVLLQDQQLQAERLKNERTKHLFEARLRELNAQWESKHSQWQQEMEQTRHMNSELEATVLDLKAHFEEKQSQWDTEKMILYRNIKLLKKKLNEKLRPESQTAARSGDEPSRNMAALTPTGPVSSRGKQVRDTDEFTSPVRQRPIRADDTDPLAPLVSQLSQRMTEVSAEVQAIKNSHTADIQALQTAVQEAGSSVYVHWGSSTCPASNSLVYSGVIGGSANTEHVSNYLCLTMSPVLSNHVVPGENVAHLLGSEYQTQDANDDKDAVCSVCRTPRSSTVMIPGTNVCEAGWTKEYSGFLMADYYPRHVATEYICVDSKLESRPASNEWLDAKMLFFTVTVCGTLPCDPYRNNTVVTCVVCSK